VEEGRAIFENIRKALLYLLSGNIAEIMVMTAAIVAGYPLPLLPIQLLWINLVTDGLPALALVSDPVDRDVLKRPPRKPGAEIADRDFVTWMLSSGLIVAACSLAAFLWGYHVEGSLERARTYAFSMIVIEQVLRAFALRSRTRVLWELGLRTNWRLVAVAVLTVALQIACHRVEPLASLLQAGLMSWREIGAVVALALVPVTIVEVWKLVRRMAR
jgi:Ca2+-transporting ATPase